MAKNPISLKVRCPVCNKSLMDHTQYLNGRPSIRVNIAHGGRNGVINLCSTYGSYDKICDIELIDNEIALLSCPFCKADLTSTLKCDICEAPIIDFKLDKGGKVHVCSRVGCKKHFVSFEDIYDTLNDFYSEQNFGADENDF